MWFHITQVFMAIMVGVNVGAGASSLFLHGREMGCFNLGVAAGMFYLLIAMGQK